MMKRSLVALAMVAAVLGAGIPALAQTCTTCCTVSLGSPWYRIASTTGSLSWGGARYYTTTLYAGVTYQIVLRVPWGVDFDMVVYDENNNVVGRSTRGGDCDEIVTVTPRWTGTFTIKVYSHSGSGWFTLQLYRR